MNTTSLLVDILIIGIQVLLWIIGFLFSFVFPVESLSTAVIILKDYPGIFLIFLITALSYAMGIAFDYVIANFFKLFKSNAEEKAYREGQVIKLLSFDTNVHKFLDNQYTRLRIAKGNLFNMPLIFISWGLFLFIRYDLSSPEMVRSLSGLIVLGIFLTIFSYIGWKSRDKVYWRYIDDTFKIIDAKKQKNN